MLYTAHELDRGTGDLVPVSLGEWLTITEAGRIHGAGPNRTRQVLHHMGFLVQEAARHRIPPAYVERGYGKRLKNPKTGFPFDVVSPEGQRLIALAWADTVDDLEAEERGEPAIRAAADALADFVARRIDGLDTEGRVRWLLGRFPDLSSQQIADTVCVSRQLVERYAKRRSGQIATLKATKIAGEAQNVPEVMADVA